MNKTKRTKKKKRKRIKMTMMTTTKMRTMRSPRDPAAKKPPCPRCGRLVGSAEIVPGYPVPVEAGRKPKYEPDYLMLPCRCQAKPDDPKRDAFAAAFDQASRFYR
jgi:hypothetical protein